MRASCLQLLFWYVSLLFYTNFHLMQFHTTVLLFRTLLLKINPTTFCLEQSLDGQISSWYKLVVIDSPSFLNEAMIYFLILSSTGSLLLLIAASPSSLNSPTFSLPIRLDSLSRRYKPTSSKIRLHRNFPLLRQITHPFLSSTKSRLC